MESKSERRRVQGSLTRVERPHEDLYVDMLESTKEEKLHLNNNEVQAGIKRAGPPKGQQEEQLAGLGWRRWKTTALKESVQEVKAQEVARLTVVKEILEKSTDFLRRIVDMGERAKYQVDLCLPRTVIDYLQRTISGVSRKDTEIRGKQRRSSVLGGFC